MEMVLPWISLLLGLLARIFLPYLAKRREDPENADWSFRYVWPQLLGVGMIIIMLPLAINDLAAVSSLPPQAAWILGWGGADIGRKAYKAIANELEE